MVIVRRKPVRARVVKAVSYGLVIGTLLGLTLWGYYKHRAARVPVEVKRPASEDAPPAAGFDRRLVYATDQELLAPPAFPWALAAVSRLPRAEVVSLNIIRTAEGAESPPKLGEMLTAGLAEQAPTIARPFTLPASPPYLVTPVTVRLEFELGEAGATAAAAVTGAPADLNAPFAERAAHLVFPPEAANVSFAATVKLIPYPYDRLSASRGGNPLSEEEYRSLFRALQYNSFPLYDTVLAVAPELITAESETRVSFVVDKEGHPGAVALEPPLPPEAGEALAATLAEIYLPKKLAGAGVQFVIGGS
jgi:hypothetical protein